MSRDPSQKPESRTDSVELEEGVDFYFDDEGLMVLTEAYLLKRGYCCGSGCRHCPYGNATPERSES